MARVVNCCGKRGFLSFEDAEHALNTARGQARRDRQRGRRHSPRNERRVYECEHGRFHLTSEAEPGARVSDLETGE